MKTQTTHNRWNGQDDDFWKCSCESNNILHTTCLVCPFCDCSQVDGTKPTLDEVVTDALKKRKAGLL